MLIIDFLIILAYPSKYLKCSNCSTTTILHLVTINSKLIKFYYMWLILLNTKLITSKFNT
ncbi:hypothetical protein OTBS_1838 [Orientia tsutsugamushi str. Boryong]|uniref:Transposase n=1 Tax=Orientia tsutsugamushi (strain Boryong) TaxID=357244 RepID=A5CF54_ORITB|nr:hypothetical protein OTBS_1838 [Orientia tsutsugamushi str. Boryong]